jgi:signal transduction histidine kinase
METSFAPAERATDEQLRRDVETVIHHPVVTTLLETASGLLAVLNEQRQILALNEAFLKLLGVDDPVALLGLRPGEAIACVHSQDMPGGCGTSRFCATCGAAIAILASLGRNRPEERKCIATVLRDGDRMELCFRVRSAPFLLNDRRFLLLFLQDITVSQRWAESERVFLHDLSSLLTGVQGAAELLATDTARSAPRMTKMLQDMCRSMTRQVELQRILLSEEFGDYQLTPEETSVRDFVDQLEGLLANHRLTRDKKLVIGDLPRNRFSTDMALLQRIIINMLTNAFEATATGGEVKLWVEAERHALVFFVWNDARIPEDVAMRVFQRHFSTKEESGRGLGTYSMKLLGEEILGGKVHFTSTERHGTTFQFRLPTKVTG